MVKSESPLDLKDEISHVRYGTEKAAYQVSTVQLPDGRFESAYRRLDVQGMMKFLSEQPSHVSFWLMVRQTTLGDVLEAKHGVWMNPPWRDIRWYNNEDSARQGHTEILELLRQGQERAVLWL